MPSPEGKPLAGARVCYVSTGAFSGATRTLKQARTLADAGAQPGFVGFRDLIPSEIQGSGYEVRAVEPLELPAYTTSQVPWRLIRIALNLTVHRLRNALAVQRAVKHHEARRSAALARAAVEAEADVVQAVDLTALESAHRAAHVLGARLVYDSHELWSGFLDNPSLGADPQWATGLLETERSLIGAASLVIVVSDPMGGRLAQKYGISAPLTLYNSPPTRVTEARPVAKPVRLVFHGGISPDRNLNELIQAMAALKGEATLDVHGFTRGVDIESLKALTHDLGLADVVRFHGAFDYERVIDLIRDYDVGVMSAKVIEENFEIALPNKLFDCMCAGLAVAMNDSEAVREIVDEVGFGVCIDPSTPQTIARDLKSLVADPERIARMKDAAVRASGRYWWPAQGEKLVAAFRDMLGRN